MVALLKQKSKIIVQQKDRKVYEAADVFKKRKVNYVDLNQAKN